MSSRPGKYRLREGKGPRHAPRSKIQTTPQARNAATASPQSPKILLLDIETAPIEAYVWGLFDQTIPLEAIKQDWSILSFAAKWLGERKVFERDTGGRGAARVRDDSRLLPELWALLDTADIVVVQNGKRFDLPKIRTRMLLAGLPPFSPVRVVDTLEAAKRHFAFTSNKLAWLTRTLTPSTQQKLEAGGFKLWVQCLADSARAWRRMRLYNRRDVVGLEPVYLKLRPWIEGHPNVAAYSDSDTPACPKCGSTDLTANGHAYTQTGKYRRYRCKCGGFARSRYTLNTTSKRRSLLSN